MNLQIQKYVKNITAANVFLVFLTFFLKICVFSKYFFNFLIGLSSCAQFCGQPKRLHIWSTSFQFTRFISILPPLLIRINYRIPICFKTNRSKFKFISTFRVHPSKIPNSQHASSTKTGRAQFGQLFIFHLYVSALSRSLISHFAMVRLDPICWTC